MCADPPLSLSSGCVWSPLWRPPPLHAGHAAESLLVYHHSSGHRRPPLTSPVHLHPHSPVQKWSGALDASVPFTSCLRRRPCCASGQALTGWPLWPTASGRHRNKRHTSGVSSRVWQWHFYFKFDGLTKTTKIPFKHNSWSSDWIFLQFHNRRDAVKRHL